MGDRCESQTICAVDADCAAGRYCSAGICTLCNLDTHCGFSCRDCTDLSNNRACVDGQCGCNDAADCAANEQCQAGMCTGCQPDCAGKCGGADDGCGGSCDSGCPLGQICNLGDCEAQTCADNADCPAGFVCQANRCRYAGCASSDDCLPGEVCLGGLCIVPACLADIECADGLFCENHTCLPCNRDQHCGPTCLNCTDPDVPGDHCFESAGSASCACSTHASCGAGHYCQGGPLDGTCSPCNTDSFCGSACEDCTALANNRACVAGACGCVDNQDCAAGDICQAGSCTGCSPSCVGKCYGGSDGCGGTCNQACASGQWCDAGTCRTCNVDAHCGPTCLDCTSPAVQGSHCAQNVGGAYCACFGSSECFSGYWCQGGAPDGICTACTTADHCGPSCVNCAANTTNRACVNGACGCLTGGDCAAGQSCVANHCVQVQPEDCTNLQDDDGDSLIDCADTLDCPDFTTCRQFRRCEGGFCTWCDQYCERNFDCIGCGGTEICNTTANCCAACRDCICSPVLTDR